MHMTALRTCMAHGAWSTPCMASSSMFSLDEGDRVPCVEPIKGEARRVISAVDDGVGVDGGDRLIVVDPDASAMR